MYMYIILLVCILSTCIILTRNIHSIVDVHGGGGGGGGGQRSLVHNYIPLLFKASHAIFYHSNGWSVTFIIVGMLFLVQGIQTGCDSQHVSHGMYTRPEK